MITITAYTNPINNGLELPQRFVLPEPDKYFGIYVDNSNYYIFETVEERDTFYAERGLTVEPGI